MAASSPRRKTAKRASEVDGDRIVADVEAGVACYLVGQWAHVDLVAIIPMTTPDDAVRPFRSVHVRTQPLAEVIRAHANGAGSLFFQFRTAPTQGTVVPFEPTLTTWMVEIDAQWARVEDMRRQRARQHDRRTFAAWEDETRRLSVSAAAQFGRAIGDDMTALATRIFEQFEWAAQRFSNPPKDAAGLADLRLSAHLYALHRVLDALKDLGGRVDVPPSHRVGGSLERVRTVSERILPERASVLVADILGSVVEITSVVRFAP